MAGRFWPVESALRLEDRDFNHHSNKALKIALKGGGQPIP
jgi:hypothetical protein